MTDDSRCHSPLKDTKIVGKIAEFQTETKIKGGILILPLSHEPKKSSSTAGNSPKDPNIFC